MALQMQLTYKKYLKTSLPFLLSTVACSLMGAVDTAVVGHLGSYYYINAVSLGAVIFSTVYWLFGFLKISTSGFAAQAFGTHNPKEISYAFLRSVFAAFCIGVVLVALQKPIYSFALYIFNPEQPTEILLSRYYNILIWVMPLTLVFQTAQGWFAGTLHVRISVLTGISANIINLILDLIFVLGLHLDVTGVAGASCIANICGFAATIYFYSLHQPLPLSRLSLQEMFHGPAFHQMLQCGTHLTIRMLCMILMVNSFLHQSSVFGGLLLAANSILFQLQFIMGDILTGLSQAAAIYSGIAFGERNRKLLNAVLKISFVSALSFGMLESVSYYLLRQPILSCFTDLETVLTTAKEYDFFIAFFPFISALGIVYYGLFNGALFTMPICISMLGTATCYLLAYFTLIPIYGNAGLWTAFLIFYVARTSLLLLFVPSLKRHFS